MFKEIKRFQLEIKPFRILFLLLFFTIEINYILSQALNFKKICSLPPELVETSGLLTLNGGKTFWSHEDSGAGPFLFELDTFCTILRKVEVLHAENLDWEDVTSDENGVVYIGDFGNNGNNRKDLSIYLIENLQHSTTNKLTAKKITFSYKNQIAFPPDVSQQHFDMEAFFWFKDSLHLFSKNRTNPFNGICYQYSFPAMPGNYNLEPIDSFNTGTVNMLLNWVCGAALSPNNQKMLLLGYDKIWSFEDFPGIHFFKGLSKIYTHSFSQTEGITFISEKEIYLSDEYNPTIRFGGNLYSTTLPFETNSDHPFLFSNINNTIVTHSVITLHEQYKMPIILYNSLGVVLRIQDQPNHEIDVSNFASGTYFLKDNENNIFRFFKI